MDKGQCPQSEDLSKGRHAPVAANAHDTIPHFPKDPTCDICMRAESNKIPAGRLAPDKRVESQAQKLGERIHVDTIGHTREGVGGCCSCLISYDEHTDFMDAVQNKDMRAVAGWSAIAS